MTNAARAPGSDGCAGDAADYTIRMAGPDDAKAIAMLVRELAVFVKHEHAAKATADDFRRHLFGRMPAAQAALAEMDGQAVGLALWFSTFSTFRGQPGLYVEDLYVKPECRGRGIGKALLAAVATEAIERGCGRVEWSVLKWNLAAIGFYRSLGAQVLDEYTTCRIDEEPLRDLAGIASKSPLARSGRNPSDD
jgi:ribosomal protein S18 acetylase RimI-like enzyme